MQMLAGAHFAKKTASKMQRRSPASVSPEVIAGASLHCVPKTGMQMPAIACMLIALRFSLSL